MDDFNQAHADWQDRLVRTVAQIRNIYPLADQPQRIAEFRAVMAEELELMRAYFGVFDEVA